MVIWGQSVAIQEIVIYDLGTNKLWLFRLEDLVVESCFLALRRHLRDSVEKAVYFPTGLIMASAIAIETTADRGLVTVPQGLNSSQYNPTTEMPSTNTTMPITSIAYIASDMNITSPAITTAPLTPAPPTTKKGERRYLNCYTVNVVYAKRCSLWCSLHDHAFFWLGLLLWFRCWNY